MSGALLAKNRKALFNYALIEKYVAGISLMGYEVKAIKEGNVNFEGSYVVLKGGSLFVTGLFVGRYSKQSSHHKEPDPTRDRALLVTSTELRKVTKMIEQKGVTAVPLALLLQHGLIKLEFAVVKGLKEFEKKNVAKERQIRRDLEKETKELSR